MTNPIDERAGAAPPASVPSDPEVFGPYLVYDRLGVGGMATVHRAKEHGIEGFERIVALKRLLPHLAEDASFVRSFVREAKLASMLQHVNIVQLYELGRVGPVYFISMELIEGKDIRKVLRQARKVSGPPSINVVVSMLTQMCDALDYAHGRTDEHGERIGLVHRDISPSNLLITRQGYIKVIDFGIAKAQSQHLKTQTGRVKGKLAYMAPEAIQGKELDGRSDLFSVGVIAHELLTARPLFATKNEYQTLLKVQREQVAPPSQFNHAVPPELDAIVLRALAKDPDLRYGSAGEMRDDLHALRVHYGLSATNREVESWMDWAFALESPSVNFSGPMVTDSLQALSRTQSGSPLPGSLPRRPSFTAAAPALSSGVPEVATTPSSSGTTLDDEAVNIAWGGDEEHEPVLLDEVPDQAGRTRRPSGDDLAATPEEPGATSASGSRPAVPADSDAFDRARHSSRHPVTAAAEVPLAELPSVAPGLEPVQNLRPRRRLYLAGAVALVLALVAGWRLLGGDRAPTTAPAPTTARLTFFIEPAEAMVRIPGLPPHSGSPYVIDIEPGAVQIEVQHPSYKTYVTSIENLEAGDTRTIRVMLEHTGASGMATLTIASSHSSVTVYLDDHKLDLHPPFDLEIAPGPHRLLTIDRRGSELWRTEFVAVANTVHAFQADRERRLSGDDRRERDPDDSDEPAGRSGGPDMLAPSIDHDDSRPRDAATAPGTGVGTLDGLEPRVALGTTAAPTVPVAPITPDRSTMPTIVPPNAVTRVSGTPPKLKTRATTPLPPTVSAKVCIDTSGSVSSVSALSGIPDDIRSQLEASLRTWRYRPYLEAGTALPACFVVTFSPGSPGTGSRP